MKNVEVVSKEAFWVIGRAGTTQDGPDFVARLWQDANGHFSEVEPGIDTERFDCTRFSASL